MSTGNLQADISSAHHQCWSCRQETGAGPFCKHCVKIQPVDELGNYFTLFGLQKSFNIDPALIKKTFYELSRRFHPDFYTVQSDEERLLSRNNTAYLNTALKVLSDPVERAEYLLSLVAGTFKSNPAPPQELFEEILEIGELLEMKSLTAGQKDKLNKVLANFENQKEKLIDSLSPLFARLLGGEAGVKDEITSRLDQIKYLKKTSARMAQVIMGSGDND